MDRSPAASGGFTHIAPRLALRVGLRRWLSLLTRTWIAASAAIVLFPLLGLLLGQAWMHSLAWLTFLSWLVGAGVWTWLHRPSLYSAFALWDQIAGRREAFASAWWFQQQPPESLSPQASAHLSAQLAHLPSALQQLPQHLPLSFDKKLTSPFVLLLLGSLLLQSLQPRVAALIVDDNMAAAAQAEAKKLNRSGWDKKQLSGLDEAEQKDLKELQKSIQQAAETLDNAAGKDARGVIADLEQRAREAEKLANRLAADRDAWASEALIRAMRRQADTADLGDAVAARRAAESATAAEKIARTLSSPQLSQDATERWSETLSDQQKSAEAADRTRLVGQHVLSAATQMAKRRTAEAGTEYQKLAEAMRQQAKREEASQQLEKLAQQLRDAGSSMAGQNQAGEMQKMAAAGQSGPQGQAPVGQSPKVPPNAGQPPSTATPPLGQAPQQMQAPGLSQLSQQMMQQTPIPGTGQPQKMQLQPGQPGQKAAPGQPMLFAPIPGQDPSQKPDALFLGPPGSTDPNGPAIALAIPGGKEPGVGKAELKADPTAASASSQQAVVTAQQNQEGASTTRSVEGGARPEAASRQGSTVVLEALAAEEAALDEAALPPARREQVRRYFTELRRRFEKE